MNVFVRPGSITPMTEAERDRLVHLVGVGEYLCRACGVFAHFRAKHPDIHPLLIADLCPICDANQSYAVGQPRWR